jgi:hypothetical protein
LKQERDFRQVGTQSVWLPIPVKVISVAWKLSIKEVLRALKGLLDE